MIEHGSYHPGMTVAERYNAKEVCRRLRIHRHTLTAYVRKGVFPQPIVVGNRHLWTEADIDQWEKQNRRVA